MNAQALRAAINLLVDEYRDRCLWFLREDFYPSSVDEQRRVLEAIERHGDVAACRRARELETWFTPLQRDICRRLAERRRAAGDGGLALQEALRAARVSRDIDIFHDTAEAVATAWDADRHTLARAGCQVEPLRERPAYVEARVSRGSETVLVEWTRDGAFRFFPLVEHPDFGLTLHPFDLATNKVLALVGRLEVRDWVDVIECADRLQPLGLLAWAACGKDPGFSPQAVLEQAARSARYSVEEVNSLAFAGPPPSAADLSRRWHGHLRAAGELWPLLPPDSVGHAVLTREGELFNGDAAALARALEGGRLLFHPGRVRGALPQCR